MSTFVVAPESHPGSAGLCGLHCGERTAAPSVYSAGLHAAARGLLRATALHVLPDTAERAHLPAEEQDAHGGLRLQRLLLRQRLHAGAGSPTRPAPQAAAAGKQFPICVFGTAAGDHSGSAGARLTCFSYIRCVQAIMSHIVPPVLPQIHCHLPWGQRVSPEKPV